MSSWYRSTNAARRACRRETTVVTRRARATGAAEPPRRGSRSCTGPRGSGRRSSISRKSSRVVEMPSISSSPSARAARAIAGGPVDVVDDDLRDQRVVVRTGRRSPRRRGCRRARPARAAAGNAAGDPATAGSRARGPRRSAGTRSRGPSSGARPAANSGAPSATRSCSRTRSTPVTSSVTGCSTWRRVFISMK